MNLLPQYQGSQFPPGGFPFTDPKSGRVFDAMAGGLADRIRDVTKHRLSNPAMYSGDEINPDPIRQEIVDFMCGKRPQLCMEGFIPVIPNPAALVQTVSCPTCGLLDAKPTFCPTCGGGDRIKFWTCNNCNTQF